MSRCLARVVNKWFHKPEFPGATDHACPFKAKRDGYCFRHHPSDTKRTLECKVTRLVETEVKKAPRLHRVKCDEAILKHAIGVCYYRMHNYLTGTPPADEPAQPVEATPETQAQAV